jgi:UTP:GlnB (protein PII) uridylyltransferase
MGRTLELNPGETERMETAIEQVILGKMDAEVLLEKRPARRPNGVGRLQPSVTFDTAASLTFTLVEIVAEDRPGLLHDLARAVSLAGCNIEVVLVDTRGHKARCWLAGPKPTWVLCVSLKAGQRCHRRPRFNVRRGLNWKLSSD